MAQRRVTLRDVAELAGVSPTTASMVLNGKARDYGISEACIRRVQHAAAGAGYAPNHHAMSMRLGRSMTIGMAVNVAGYRQGIQPLPLTDNPYYIGLIFGAEGAIHEAGYDFLLIGPGKDMDARSRAVEALRRGQIDALLADHLPPAGAEPDPPQPIAVVLPIQETALPTIEFDHASAARRIAEHLAELGHRCILWLGPSEEVNRETLVLRAASQAGLHMVSRIYELLNHSDYEDKPHYEVYRVESARRALAEQLAKPRDFTAVVAYSDRVAMGACRALRQAGLRVPEDVSVVGWDNTPASGLFDPPLTTIDHAFAEMGYQAGRLACEMARGGRQAVARLQGECVTVPAKLLVRESSGPAGGEGT